MIVTAPISVGELIDKITILQIKLERISDTEKLININEELNLLIHELHKLELPDIVTLTSDLHSINAELWDIEDFKRSCEKTQNFGDEFILAARQVYFKNDIRARIKKEINIVCGSSIVEEKSYK